MTTVWMGLSLGASRPPRAVCPDMRQRVLADWSKPRRLVGLDHPFACQSDEDDRQAVGPVEPTGRQLDGR
jgi:hypothetical protein